jgi:hypothetical protein
MRGRTSNHGAVVEVIEMIGMSVRARDGESSCHVQSRSLIRAQCF